MAFAQTSMQLVMKAQSAVSGVWNSLQGLFGYSQYSDFSPEEVLAKTPNIDPRFIAKAPMSNENLDIHTLDQLGKMGLKRGKEITAQSHPELYQAFTEMSARAGLKHPPQLILAESKTVNALTITPQEMCVTTGFLKVLNLREVSAVLGHELGHATSNHNQPRLLALAGFGIPGAILGDMVSQRVLTPVAMGQKALPFFQRARNWIATGPSNLLRTATNVLGILAGAYAGQIAAHYAAYRPTELDADRKGAYISGDPEGLISALNKLENTHKSKSLVRSINQLLSSHPSTETRINRLRTIAQTMPEAPAAPVAEVAPIPVAAMGSSPTALITGAALAEQRVSAMDAPAMANG